MEVSILITDHLDAIASSTAVSSGVNLTDDGVTDRVRGELVSGNYFDVLEVRPAAGRVLAPAFVLVGIGIVIGLLLAFSALRAAAVFCTASARPIQ